MTKKYVFSVIAKRRYIHVGWSRLVLSWWITLLNYLNLSVYGAKDAIFIETIDCLIYPGNICTYSKKHSSMVYVLFVVSSYVTISTNTLLYFLIQRGSVKTALHLLHLWRGIFRRSNRNKFKARDWALSEHRV